MLVVGVSGKRISAKPMSTETNETALRKKQAAVPTCTLANAPMTRPATAGPSKRAPLKVAELSAMALGKSALPTISTMNDCRAGMSKALIVPNANESTATCQMVTPRERVSPANASAGTMERIW